MLMLVAVGVAAEAGVEEVLRAYELMSKLVYTHATPTLFNAATTNAQLSSCFLLQMKSDSIRGIFQTLQATALISKSAGGVGLSLKNLRAPGRPNPRTPPAELLLHTRSTGAPKSTFISTRGPPEHHRAPLPPQAEHRCTTEHRYLHRQNTAAPQSTFI